MPSAASGVRDLDYEPDFSDLDPDERDERTRASQPEARAFWPEDIQAQEALATERLATARQNATVFRARRLARTGHGLEEPDQSFPIGIPAIDTLLCGGLQRNELIELVGWRSSGRFSATLSVLAGATQRGDAAALVDLGDQLDPQAALSAGIDLERLLWLRPQTIKEAMGSTELLLGAGFPLVVLDLGQPPVRGGRGIESGWLRLQRGAIDHHAALLVSSPYRASGTAAHAVVELHGARAGWFNSSQQNRRQSERSGRAVLGGLVCAAELAKSRLRRLDASPAKPTVKAPSKNSTDQRRLAHFELYFASGMAEPSAKLPKLRVRKRRQRVAATTAEQPKTVLMVSGAGALRHAG